MTRPDVSVLIVTYNSSHVIDACLSALGSTFEIIVYDNASSDDSVALIQRDFPLVRVILGDRNLGFAAGVNRAAAQANGRNIMLLNPDAVIAVDDVWTLVETMASTNGGIVAPLIHTDGVRVAAAGRMPTAWSMATHYFGVSRLARGRRWLQGHYLLPSDIGDDVVTVDWVTGACLMVEADTWRRLGGLSERWFMYAEDIEFCWRVGRTGGVVLVQPRARAGHLVGRSNNKPVSETDSAWVLNLYEFYRTDIARCWAQRLWWGVVVGAGLAFRSLVFRVQSVGGSAAEHRPSARRFAIHSRAVFGSLTTASEGR